VASWSADAASVPVEFPLKLGAVPLTMPAMASATNAVESTNTAQRRR
jgi:hypothetical protein